MINLEQSHNSSDKLFITWKLGINKTYDSDAMSLIFVILQLSISAINIRFFPVLLNYTNQNYSDGSTTELVDGQLKQYNYPKDGLKVIKECYSIYQELSLYF